MKGPLPLSVGLGPSKLAIAFVVVAYLATATIIAWVPGATIYRALTVIAIGAHAVWTLRAWALRSTHDAVVRIEVAADGSIAFCQRSGARREGRLLPSSYVGTQLTTVVVRVDGLRWPRSQEIGRAHVCTPVTF